MILARSLGSAWQFQQQGVLSQDQRCLQTVFSRPTPFSDVLCLETSVFRRELSSDGCLRTSHVWRHFSSEDASLKTYYVWKHSSQDSLCLESLHFSAQNIFDFFKVYFVNMYRVSIRSCFCYPIHVLYSYLWLSRANGSVAHANLAPPREYTYLTLRIINDCLYHLLTSL